GALVEIEGDVALQPDGKCAVGSGSYKNCPTACCGRGVDCFINGRTVERLSVALRAEFSDVERAGKRGAFLNDGAGNEHQDEKHAKWFEHSDKSFTQRHKVATPRHKENP